MERIIQIEIENNDSTNMLDPDFDSDFDSDFDPEKDISRTIKV